MLKTNRGEGTFGIIVILVIVAAVTYVGFKWGYASWDAAEFREQLNKSVIYWTSHGAPTKENAIIETELCFLYFWEYPCGCCSLLFDKNNFPAI